MIKKITYALLVLCLSNNLVLAASNTEYPGIELNYGQDKQTVLVNGSLNLLNQSGNLETVDLENQIYHLTATKDGVSTYKITLSLELGDQLLLEHHTLKINASNGNLMYSVEYECAQNTCLIPLDGKSLGSASTELKPEKE